MLKDDKRNNNLEESKTDIPAVAGRLSKLMTGSMVTQYDNDILDEEWEMIGNIENDFDISPVETKKLKSM